MKNIKSTLYTALIIIFCFNIFSNLNAQVTIGSTSIPKVGALLDLTEGDTTSKGLGLPRVKLKSLKATNSDLRTTIDGVSTSQGDPWDLNAHIGLLIYNVEKDDTNCPNTDIGIHVWNGSEWEPLQGEVMIDQTNFVENGDGTGLLTDFEGNTYTTKKWGGKHWMTQNLRSIRGADGEYIGCTEGLNINPASFNNGYTRIKVQSSIPEGMVADYINAGTLTSNQTYEEYATEFGLLYNWTQANKACPKGWHLSTYAEWTDLITAMGNGNKLAHEMKKNNNTFYKAADLSVSYRWGATGVTENGFNATPSGSIDPLSNKKGACYFSTSVNWWIANPNQYFAEIDYDNPELIIRSTGTYYNAILSVRCVKD